MDCPNEISSKRRLSNFSLVRALFGRAKNFASVSVAKLVPMAPTKKPTNTSGGESTKKKKKRQRSEEPEPDPEPERVVDSDDDDDDDVDDDAGSDNEADDAQDDGHASEEEQQEGEEKKDRDTRQKLKSRRAGYRRVAKKAGFSADFVSGTPHLDVVMPILSTNETIRACKWAPRVADAPAYSGFDEFEERTKLSHQPLPPSSADVIREHGEAYLRRLMTGAVQRMSDNNKKAVTIKEMAPETRPLARVQKYSFAAPHGLVHFVQKGAPKERLECTPEDEIAYKSSEHAALLKKQVAYAKDQQSKADKDKAKRMADRKAAKAARAQGVPPPARKKSKKGASAS